MEYKPTFRLFEEFPEISTEQWEAKILEDLKGADYQRLIWKTADGLQLKPYYRQEDLEQLTHMQASWGYNEFARNLKGNNEWEISQIVQEHDPRKANLLALAALGKGAESVEFDARNILAAEDLQLLLKDLSVATTPLHFSNSPCFPDLLQWLDGLSPNGIKGSLGYDPLGHYALYEYFPSGKTRELEVAAELIIAAAKHSGMRVIQVSGNHFSNAGASIVQELAFALAQGHEYLHQLLQQGIAVEATAKHMGFTFGIGSDYFPEMARLRAARILWAKILDQYGLSDRQSMVMQIHAVTSPYNKTIYDPFVNMLRTTSEAMSAALGGADRITVLPFDSSFKRPDEFSERISRNLQQILKHEAYFNKVADVPGGSYYIENLTNAIASEAWKQFQQIEQMGGFLSCVESGFIKQAVRSASEKRQAEVAQRKQVFVGVNQYPNPDEEMLEKLQPVADTTAIAELKPARATQQLEALRLAVENHKKKGFKAPEVFLLTFGNAAMRKARADFATGFFSVAGYRILNHKGFASPQEGATAAAKAEAPIVVFCSSDEEYAGIAPAIAHIKKTAPKTIIIVAGYPKEMVRQLEQDGVDYFIHLRANLYDALSRFNEILGIA